MVKLAMVGDLGKEGFPGRGGGNAWLEWIEERTGVGK